MTIPNILTLSRLALIPLVVALLWAEDPAMRWWTFGLFALLAVTDWLDGYLARRLRQHSALGALMDPIADKVLVAALIAGLLARGEIASWDVAGAILILCREFLVSGLREFLAQRDVPLPVTNLAKWKTTVQMIAIAVLFAQGVFEHYLGMSVFGMDQQMIEAILDGEVEDHLGLGWKLAGMEWAGLLGLVLLWIAAVLTAITGFDYLRKALPHLKEPWFPASA